MTKLCGGVGFTSHLAGEALSVLSVHLSQLSLLVLACLDLQRPRHDRPADHLECAGMSKHETRKQTIAKRSPYVYCIALIRPLKPPTSHPCLPQFTPRVHLTHLFAFNDAVSSTRFSARCIGLVLPLERSICFLATHLASHLIFSSHALFNSW